MIKPPDRSLAQRMAALERANVIRSQRAQLKRDLKAGRVRLIDLIVSPPDWAEEMKLFDALLATPKYGRVKTQKVLNTARISPSKTLGGITMRQRIEICRQLPYSLAPEQRATLQLREPVMA